MRVGFFGGSFDPVHNGHIEPVLEAAHAAELERVVYCPTGVPPHKPDRSFAPALARYAMVELALLERPEFIVSAHELFSTDPTYTYDTVEHFRRTEPSWDLHLLLGSDAFAQLHEYHRWREIVEAVPLVVMLRPGFERPSAAEQRPEILASIEAGRVRFVVNRAVAASSSELRRVFERGEAPPLGWVPEPVVEFIRKYRLYR